MKAHISTTESEQAHFDIHVAFFGFELAVNWFISESLRTIHDQINQRCEAALNRNK